MPIHTMHIANVRNRKRGNRRESGMVNQRAVVIGQRRMKQQTLVSDDLIHGLSATSDDNYNYTFEF